ncbi:putative hydrolase of the HAD superfamily [Flavobacterium sp. 28A]|uniref:HAD family hydrolase n=1 Tax=Flavobacterium sp. 28A TaxID=2735895 RepID=UPI00156E0AE5|nr:HAD family hydrolase [Flavobacterium sp. 28A]NRT16997.1 putative hydrolase of the HAD superfamily [Flavobacterium sp. 28A]
MKLDYANYNHLSFDLWLTLIKSNPEFKSKRNKLFKDYFEIEDSIEKVNEVVRYYDVLCNSINEKTGLNFNTFEIYYLILNSLNVKIEVIDAIKLEAFYTETELLFMQYKPNLIDPNIGLLFKEVTEKGKTINILSNTGFIKGFTLRKLLTHYDLNDYFSFQLYSDETGISKPNQDMFKLVYDQVCEKEFVEKKRVLHVGDNPIADRDGALKFGFSALLI